MHRWNNAKKILIVCFSMFLLLSCVPYFGYAETTPMESFRNIPGMSKGSDLSNNSSDPQKTSLSKDQSGSSKLVAQDVYQENKREPIDVPAATYGDVFTQIPSTTPDALKQFLDKHYKHEVKSFPNISRISAVGKATYTPYYYYSGQDWKRIDTGIYQDNTNSNFTHSMLSNYFNVRLNNKEANPYITFSLEDQSVTYQPYGMNNVTGVVYDNSIIFRDAWQSTDLLYQVLNDQLKMEIHLENNKAPSTFEFELKTKNVKYYSNANGSIDFIDEQGEVSFRIPQPWVMDAAKNIKRYDKLDVKVLQKGNKTFVEYTLDDRGLVYPIVIDPTTTTVEMGNSHSIRLTANGRVLAWGSNSNGQLGNGSNLSQSLYPIGVYGLTDVIDIATGWDHSIALKQDGSVWSWGMSFVGALGTGITIDTKVTPTQITGLSDMIAVASGDDHGLALKRDGTVWSWGYNNYGELGNGTNTTSTTPVQVIGLTDVKAIAAGKDASLALKKDGSLWAWGGVPFLGNGSMNNSYVPVKVSNLSNVISMSVSEMNAFAVQQDGSVWAWGLNQYGLLGGNATNLQYSLTPVQVKDLSNITDIKTGRNHALVLKQDGTVYGWGKNNNGQMGNGATTDSFTPVQVTGLSNVESIAASWSRSSAISQDGYFWSWGEDKSVSGEYRTIPTRVDQRLEMEDIQPPTSPNSLVVSKTKPTALTLSWDRSTDNVGVFGYHIYKGSELIGITMDTSFIIKDLTELTSYTFEVKARDITGNESQASSITGTTSEFIPSIDLNITKRTSTSISLSWKHNLFQPAKYQIFNGDTLIATQDAVNESYIVQGLNENTTYTFKVKGIDTNGIVLEVSNQEIGSTDVTPPTAPTSLIVTDREIESVTLAWGASSDNIGVKGYYIYLNGWKRYEAIVDGSMTSYTVKGIRPNYWHTFTLEAIDYAGNISPMSNSVTVSTDVSPPSFVFSNLTVSNRTEDSISFSWDRATDNIGVTNYDIFIGGSLVATVDGTTRSYTISGLEPNRTYLLEVKARDAAGNTSSKGPVANVSTDLTPPTAPIVKVDSWTGSSITISWTASTDNIAAIGYEIFMGSSRVGSVYGEPLKYTITDLNANTSYTLTVKAIDGAGNYSESSNSVSASTDATPPLPPASVFVTNRTATSAELNWSASSDNIGIASYNIYREGYQPILIATVAGTSLNYTVSGLGENLKYTFSVRAKDAAGNISEPTHVVVNTDVKPPSIPNVYVFERAANRVGIKWFESYDNMGVTNYDIYNGSTLVTSLPRTARNYTLTGLIENTTYSISVKARDEAGNVSSETVTVSTDITPPSEPNVSVKNRTGTSVTLKWYETIDNVGVVSYQIREGDKVIGTTTATTYEVTGLIENTTYRFSVYAVDAAGNSASDSITVSTDITPPTAVDSISLTSRTGNTVVVSWAPATDNVAVTEYILYINSLRFQELAGNVTSATINLPFNENRIFVRAKDAAGNVSNSGSKVLFLPKEIDTTPPTTPYSLRISNRTDSSITLAWGASSDNFKVDGYDIYNGLNKIGTTSATVTSYTVTGINGAVKNEFTVRARDTEGNISDASNLVFVGPPTAPTFLRISNRTDSSITLTWGASIDDSQIAGYDIYNGSSKIGTTNATTYTLYSINNTLKYEFTVKARDAEGNVSEASNSILISPSAKIGYHYDSSGRLDYIQLDDGTVIDYQYDANGNLVAVIKQ
ncbi:fibronectin type III domain-containing protein [Paenibacillus sp. NPDC056579]|uniref:RCC1 domain-containing protein n=1 Tax=Paenibacillus sp. NPDC056579 TaxID=3345871 RepID=UPI003676FF62